MKTIEIKSVKVIEIQLFVSLKITTIPGVGDGAITDEVATAGTNEDAVPKEKCTMYNIELCNTILSLRITIL